jgi:predicted Holliday junction resolvase-like endonuclease
MGIIILIIIIAIYYTSCINSSIKEMRDKLLSMEKLIEEQSLSQNRRIYKMEKIIKNQEGQGDKI